MLDAPFFYHNTSRKLVNVFGNMFNDITIHRFDANNNTIQTLPVPISYGSKQKYILMNTRYESEGQKLQIQIPQIVFLLNGIAFDTSRKVNPINVNVYTDPNRSVMKSQFVQLPVTYNFDLSILTRNTDDAFQIIESIVPFFHGSFTNNVKLFPEMDLNFDVRTTMNEAIQIQDDYMGSSESSKIMTHTLNFTMSAWMAGPVRKAGVIKRAQVDLIPVTDEEYSKFGRQSRIVVEPGLTATGEPTSDPALTIPYSEIAADDPYGFITEIFFFQDGKKFNPVTLQDEIPKP